MPDYTSTSPQIWEWLTAQGVTFEVDEFAPKVWWSKIDAAGLLYVALRPRLVEDKYICPFFGPGGADNSLKALRGWCEKKSYDGDVLHYLTQGSSAHYWSIYVIDTTVEGDECYHLHSTNAKTDGIALHDLLYKLMEAK